MADIQKIQKVKQELARRDICLTSVVPPLWRLLWRCGLPVAPPLFAGFTTNFVTTSAFVTALCLSAAYISPWGSPASLLSGLLQWGSAAAIFGFLDSIRTRRRADKLGVPRWSDCA